MSRADNERRDVFDERAIHLGAGFKEQERPHVLETLVALGAHLKRWNPDEDVEVSVQDRGGKEQRVTLRTTLPGLQRQELISRKLGERIARKQAVDWVTGTGTTLPFGIARAGLTANVTLLAGNALTYAKLLEVETALDPAYEQNAKRAMNKATWQAIRAIVGTDGRPLVQESAQAGIGTSPNRSLLGYPVVIDQAFPNHSTLSAKFAMLGDLREAYVIRRVSNVVVMVNPYSSAASGQVEYTAWERADGNVQNRAAYSLVAANAA